MPIQTSSIAAMRDFVTYQEEGYELRTANYSDIFIGNMLNESINAIPLYISGTMHGSPVQEFTSIVR